MLACMDFVSYQILLVEDEILVRNLLTRVLKLQGYQVHAAENGLEALRLYQALDGRIDLVLTDLVMPKMGGRQLEENLRLLGCLVPVSFMTGWASELCEECACAAFTLVKPFRPADLLAHLAWRLAKATL